MTTNKDNAHEKTHHIVTFQVSHLESIIFNESVGKKAHSGLFERCRIHIHHKRKRLADPGACSHKAIIDGLVKAGIFEDDSLKFITEISETQEKSNNEETIIEIEEVDDA